MLLARCGTVVGIALLTACGSGGGAIERPRLPADNVVLFTYGKEPRSFPSPLATDAISVFGVGAYPLQLIIPVVGLIAAGLLSFFTRRTKFGKAMI